MNFARSSLWTFFSTSVKVVTGFIVTKVLAIMVGATGVAIIGQLNNFLSIVMATSTAGIQQGLIKYTSQFKDSKDDLRTLFSTSLWYLLLGAILTAIAVLIFRGAISNSIFGTREYSHILLVLVFTIIFYAINSFFISIVNGFKEIKILVYSNVSSSLIGLITTCLLVYYYGINGALLAIVINLMIVIFPTLILIRKKDWFIRSNFKIKVDKGKFISLSRYSLMTLVAAFTMPFALVLIRNMIVARFSWAHAGIWDGLWRISGTYLMVLTTAFSVYLLPTFSSLPFERIRKEVISVWKIVIPVAISFASVLYFFREMIIQLLFSKEFAPMAEIFAYQMIGDTIKVTSWVLGNLMIAKAMMTSYIVVQVIFSASFVGLAYYLVDVNGLVGVTQAYLLNYFFHFIFMCLYFRKMLFGSR